MIKIIISQRNIICYFFVPDLALEDGLIFSLLRLVNASSLILQDPDGHFCRQVDLTFYLVFLQGE